MNKKQNKRGKYHRTYPYAHTQQAILISNHITSIFRKKPHHTQEADRQDTFPLIGLYYISLPPHLNKKDKIKESKREYKKKPHQRLCKRTRVHLLAYTCERRKIKEKKKSLINNRNMYLRGSRKGTFGYQLCNEVTVNQNW